jgi:hypothetical protein
MRKNVSILFKGRQNIASLKNAIQVGLNSGVAKKFNPKKHLIVLKRSKLND